MPELDTAHKALFDMMDLCIDKMRDNENIREDLLATIELLIAHGKVEEQMMLEFEFPYIEHHLAAHRETEVKMKSLVGMDHAIPTVGRFTISTLEDVLVKHVDHADRQLADFINRKAKTK